MGRSLFISLLFIASLHTGSAQTTVDKQITSENKTYAKALTETLNKSYPWMPYMHGGMALSFYMRIYVRINEDRTVRVDLRQP